MTDCPFCQLEEARDVIAQTPLCVAFYDRFPVNPGHALIIPRRHVASYFDLTAEEIDQMQTLLQEVKRVVSERFAPDGFNIGVNVGEAAGQSVFHVHMHLIPRYRGDVANPRGGVRGVILARQNYGSGRESA